ncbi:hypothetical protein TNIN_441311 [Trichonephila inaurata madagascariensis]|uniref:Uncharacterized protein n=1 Tax=Trichonephila inaurata madagascariensis TaxID=2747483 RepID=A0A8X6YUZ2_9ARAC|nr:hypothetical protein TNIN_441311 [Trichonephila inaurata madagascariensis]
MYGTRNSKRRPEVQSNAEFPTSTTDTVSKIKIKCKKPIQDKKVSKTGRNLDRICKKVEDKSSDKENPNKSKRVSPQASIKNNLQPLKPSNVQIILTQMQLSEKDKKLNSKKITHKENPEILKKTERILSRKCNKITDKKMDQENQNKTSVDKKTLMKVKHPPMEPNNAHKFSTRAQSLKPKKVKELKADKSNNDGNLNKLIKIKKATSTKVKQLKDNYITEAEKDSELPLGYNSEKLVRRVPVWAVSQPLTKQTKKRSCLSDIYDINQDENIMNDTPVEKKKKICSKKLKVIKPKVSKKKIGLPHVNKTIKTCLQEVNKPIEKFAKIVNIVENNKVMQTIHQPGKKCENLNSVQSDNDLNSEAFDPKPVDNNIEKFVEVYENVLQTIQPFKVKSDVEDSIKECISSFYNFDTSLSISSVFKNKDKLCEVNKTPVKENSHNAVANFELNVDADNLSEKHLFLVPQMTSTPESAVHPFDPVRCPKFSSKQIPDVSSIPGSAFRNISKDLSDSEFLSPVKSTTDGPEIMPFQSSFDKVQGKEIFKEKTHFSIKSKGKDTLKQNQTVKKKIQLKDMKNIGKLDDHSSSKENGIIPQKNQKRGRKHIVTQDVNCVNKEVHGIDEDAAALKYVESSNEAEKAKKKLKEKTHSEQAALKGSSNKDNLLEPVTTIGNSLNTYEIKLFESPIKEELVRKKYRPPVKKAKFEWDDDEEFFSSPEKFSPSSYPLKSDFKEQVLPSKKSYSSPNLIKRWEVKRKLEQKKTRPVTKVDKFIEEMNKHFSDLEDTELIID